MQVTRPGHEYLLERDNGSTVLHFVEGPADARISDGTTTEEVLKALIHRLTFLDGKFPSPYNSEAIAGLNVALVALEKRTADRVERGVEGTDAA